MLKSAEYNPASFGYGLFVIGYIQYMILEVYLTYPVYDIGGL